MILSIPAERLFPSQTPAFSHNMKTLAVFVAHECPTPATGLYLVLRKCYSTDSCNRYANVDNAERGHALGSIGILLSSPMNHFLKSMRPLRMW